MKYIYLTFLILLGCSGNGGGGTSAGDLNASTVDPIYGSWIYEYPGATASTARALGGIIKADGTINIIYIYAHSDGRTITSYYRRQSGTFVRSGDQFKMTYSYETCNPVSTETITLKIGSSTNQLHAISADNTVISMVRMADSTSPISSIMIEDKNCDILAKIESKSTRLPASSRSNSSFDKIKQ